MMNFEQRAIREFQRGAAHYNRGDDAQADVAFTSAIDCDSRPAHFHLFRGLCRLRLNRLEQAQCDLSAALERNPESHEAAWARGRILANQQQYTAAIQDFSRVIALRPAENLAYSARGEMYYHLRDWQRCLDDYCRAVVLSRDDPKSLNRLAWLMATCPDDTIRNGQRSLQLAARANQLCNQADPLILDTLAAAYAECGQHAQATAAIQQALQIVSPDNRPDLLRHQSSFEANKPWRD
jgi:tetratricopeptide (TPR) repeat protein